MDEQSKRAVFYTASLSKGSWRYFCLFVCLFKAASVVVVVVVVAVGGWVEGLGGVSSFWMTYLQTYNEMSLSFVNSFLK